MSIHNQHGNKHSSKKQGIKSLHPGFTEIKAGGSDSILASMFFTIMNDIGVGQNRWNHLMSNYVLDKNNCIPNNTKDQSSARGNLQKELFKKKMTWKVFCKGLRFLNILKFDLVIRAHHSNGVVTEHIKTINFGTYEEENQNDEKDE